MSSNFSGLQYDRDTEKLISFHDPIEEYAVKRVKHELATQQWIFNPKLRTKNHAFASEPLEDSYERWTNNTDIPVRIPNDFNPTLKDKPNKHEHEEDHQETVKYSPGSNLHTSINFLKRIDAYILTKGYELKAEERLLNPLQYEKYSRNPITPGMSKRIDMENRRVVTHSASGFHMSRLLEIFHVSFLKRKWEIALKTFKILIRLALLDTRPLFPIAIEILKNLNQLEFNKILKSKYNKDLTNHPELLQKASALIKNDILIEKFYEDYKLNNDIDDQDQSSTFPTFHELSSVIRNSSRTYSRDIIKYLNWMMNTFVLIDQHVSAAYPKQTINSNSYPQIYDTEAIKNYNENDKIELLPNLKRKRHVKNHQIMWVYGTKSHIPEYFYCLIWEYITNGSYNDAIDLIELVKYKPPFSRSHNMLQYLLGVCKYIDLSIDYFNLSHIGFNDSYLVQALKEKVVLLKKHFKNLKESKKKDWNSRGQDEDLVIPYRSISNGLTSILEEIGIDEDEINEINGELEEQDLEDGSRMEQDEENAALDQSPIDQELSFDGKIDQPDLSEYDEEQEQREWYQSTPMLNQLQLAEQEHSQEEDEYTQTKKKRKHKHKDRSKTKKRKHKHRQKHAEDE